MAIIARLAGYNDKLAVEANVTVKVKDMSDAELQQRIAELAAKVRLNRAAV